jgi:hypothetical protein
MGANVEETYRSFMNVVVSVLHAIVANDGCELGDDSDAHFF